MYIEICNLWLYNLIPQYGIYYHSDKESDWSDGTPQSPCWPISLFLPPWWLYHRTPPVHSLELRKKIDKVLLIKCFIYIIWSNGTIYKYAICHGMQNIHRPALYSFNLCCTDNIALWTDCRLTRLLILAAVPISSVNILFTMDNCPFCGIISDIILVPFLKKNQG